MAYTALELQKLNARLIPYRVVGLVLSAVGAWFLAGALTGWLVLLQALAALVAARLGVWFGEVVGLRQLRG